MFNLNHVFVLTFLFLSVVGSQVPPEYIQSVLQYHRECKLESNLDNFDMLAAMYGNFMENPQMKQHLLCINRKFGIQNENGEPQIDVLKTILGTFADLTIIDQVMSTCPIPGTDPADTAQKMATCIFQIYKQTQ